MSLIKCKECKKEVSDQAEFCPHCGKPIKPVLIERTGKSWKLAKLIFGLLFIVGLLLFLNGIGSNGWEDVRTGSGFNLAFLSFIGLMVAKFGAWWHHD